QRPHMLPPLSLHDALPIFAVEHAQGIHDHPALAVGVELLAMLLEERAQRRQVPVTAIGSPMTHAVQQQRNRPDVRLPKQVVTDLDRKSTRLNSSHVKISYA